MNIQILLLVAVAAVLYVMYHRKSQAFKVEAFKDTLQIGGVEAAQASAEPNTVVVVSSFTSNSLVKGWIIETIAPGVLSLCTLRKASSGIYTIIGESSYQATKVGKQVLDLEGLSRLPVQAGDFYGFRSIGKTIVREAVKDASLLVMSNSNKTLGVGSSLDNTSEIKGKTYAVTPVVQGIFIAPDDNKPGSHSNPAYSAQQIVEHYSANNLGLPKDGIYWIRFVQKIKDKDRTELYCNFSLRPGFGYALIGCAGIGNTWPNFDSGRYPFNPNFSHGSYDKYGRTGTYYMNWTTLDRSAISDNDLNKCKKGGYTYNVEGKYCGDKDGKRLKVKGGITEILLGTGNGKYWVVLDRETLSGSSDRTIVPIASSNNFKGECGPNKNVFIKAQSGEKGEPWINMGTNHACGGNYMFWGEDNVQANELFKNANEGVQVYIGGSYQPKEKNFRHNPSLHIAPGRKTGRSTYKEALNVCRSLGKKVCTKTQLEQAQDDGFGSISCGWTATGPDKQSLQTDRPISIDIWASSSGSDLNECTIQSKSTGQSDIFCCDAYEFNNFEYLDTDYKKATLWIIKLEQAFQKRYGITVPVATKLVVYGSGKGVSVQKISESAYDLVSHATGKAPSKWPQSMGANMDPYTATFNKTGCPNPDPSAIDWWKKQSDGAALGDMHTYCELNRNGKANLRQVNQCCGKGKTCKPANCTKQTALSKSSVPFCQIAKMPRASARAMFITPLPDFGINANHVWDGSDARGIVKYGASIKLYNDTAQQHLVTTNNPYHHLPGKHLPQVIGHSENSNNVWKVEPVQEGRANTSIANGDLVYLNNIHVTGRLAANSSLPTVNGSAPGDVLITVYMKNNNLTDCQWRVQSVDGGYWYTNSKIRLQHVNTGKVLSLTGGTHQTKLHNGTHIKTISGTTHYDHRSVWSTQVVTNANKGTKLQQCTVYLNKIARARQLTLEKGPSQAAALRSAQELVDQFDKECYDIPQEAYNKTIWKLYKEIRKQLKLLAKETGLYNNYHSKEVALTNNLKGQETLMNQKEAELQKFKARNCKPVRKCVDNVTESGSVNKICRELEPLLTKGIISDELIDKIKDLKQGDLNINDYDIRSHGNATKYVRNNDIDRCV
jgi:hypothetical protein